MSARDDGSSDEKPASGRLDKWLWAARFFKTRSRAAKAAAEGVRVNGARTEKPGAAVRPGDVLTFSQADRVRIVEIRALAARRGPAEEAEALYVDRSPPPAPREGRPGKRARAEARALRVRPT